MGVRNLEANVDSRLVANHVLGEYVAKEENMVQYLEKTKSLIQGFDRFTIKQVPRRKNQKSGCAKQDCIHKLCTPVKTSISGNPEKQIHFRDGGIHGDRGGKPHMDDPYHRIHK